MNPRRALAGLYGAARSAVDPARAVARALEDERLLGALASARRLGIFAVGKAAARMLQGTAAAAARTLVVLPRGYPAPRRGGEVLFASHPEPDSSSVAAARRALAFFASFDSAEDLILCLVSGGASALLCLPRTGLSLAEKRRRIGRLARSGASIVEINRLRTSLSDVKGGKLGRATPARLATLVLSDVPGDRAALVGSGPTIRGRRGDLVRVVATNRSGLDAAAAAAAARGLAVRLWPRRVSGEAREAGGRLAEGALRLRPGKVLLAGGETTVTLGRRRGAGGRSLELALGAARTLAGSDVTLLAAGSDGRDGSAAAAGAFADGSTLERGARLGLDPVRALAAHDTEPFFAALGDLFTTGPTGTNVADWVFALRGET